MIQCPLCKGNGRLLWKDRKYKAYRCKNCRVAFLYPAPETPENIYSESYFQKWYIRYYEERKEYIKELFLLFDKYLDKKGKLLDVGCGIGILLDVAKENGWDVYGQDIAHFAIDYCRSKGYIVYDNPLPELNLTENYFDMITIFDVLAHLKDPVSYINTCAKLLKPGGYLIIKTPYHSSLLFFLANLLSFTGKSRSLLHIPAQIFHFNLRTINLISKEFFRIVKVSHINDFTSFNKKIYFHITKKKSLIIILQKYEFIKGNHYERKTVVVMPAYNAEKTLEKTVSEIPVNVVDEIILVDDGSKDRTVEIAKQLGIKVVVHSENKGYGGNQKTCYKLALESGADYIIMVHPDYQYDARVIPYALGFVKLGICDIVLGNRIRTRKEALSCGMPLYKYIANRFLTIIENFITGQNLGEWHSGFRIYRREVLETVPYEKNSDGFIFDTEFLVQAVVFGFKIGDIPIPVRYFKEASSINLKESIKYGILSLIVLLKYIFYRIGIKNIEIFQKYEN